MSLDGRGNNQAAPLLIRSLSACLTRSAVAEREAAEAARGRLVDADDVVDVGGVCFANEAGNGRAGGAIRLSGVVAELLECVGLEFALLTEAVDVVSTLPADASAVSLPLSDCEVVTGKAIGILGNGITDTDD